MARAKRTDRTDARRRYRAEQAAATDLDLGDEGADETTAGAQPARPAGPQRPNIRAAFSGAYRQANIMDDLRNAKVVFTNLGFLASLVLTVIAAAWFVAVYNGPVAAVTVGDTAGLSKVVQDNSLPYFVGTMFLQPPPAVGAFLVGFSAKRASWLGGLVYGIFATIVIIAVIQTPSGRLFTADQPNQAMIVNAAALSPIGSMLFASALAWYRRFLDLTNPNRGQRPVRQQGKGAAQRGRGNAPRGR